MVLLPFAEITDFVRSKLDELSDNSSFVASDNIDIAKIIDESAVMTIRTIHLLAPNVLLDGKTLGSASGIALNAGRDEMYWFEVPSDFMRLISLKINGWDRPVQTLVAEDSVEYRKQRNKYLRGTLRNPVAVLRHGVQNQRIIELYVCKPNPSIYDFSYVPEIYTSSNGVMICPKLKQACLYAVTAEVMRCLGEAQKAQTFEMLARESLNPTPDIDRLYPMNGEKVIE